MRPVQRQAPDIRLGIDTGGTFTDFVLLEGDRLRVHKVLSTPEAPERAILQGIAELGLDTPAQLARLRVVHGSTVATNAVLEGKGVPTVFITNRGLGDMLSLGRQARAALYDLQPPRVSPPVPHEYCLETGGRRGADGGVVEPLTAADVAALVKQVAALAPQAVAINLLYSYLDEGFERTLESALAQASERGDIPPLFITRSSALVAEYREYERGITTWLNAWVGPLVQGYLARLAAGLGGRMQAQSLREEGRDAPDPLHRQSGSSSRAGARLSVMQSAGGTVAADQAGQQAVHMLLSGPAGGLAGAGFVAACAGRTRLLTFDMGGTSTDVALLDGEPQLTTEGRIAGYPVAVPMVDMHTLGAGGGSIARVDAGGLLQVGPASAGAAPGPACYGRGGTQATVTDANLILGRLRAEAFLGGGMRLDVQAARSALIPIGQALGLSVEATAAGIVRVANEHMARALRVMSVQRGIDPGGLTLVSFGGAGGLHVCALAEALGMREALVPIHAGVLSALGMLVAPRARQLSQTLNHPLTPALSEKIAACCVRLSTRGREALADEGVAAASMRVESRLDLRYHGQSYALTVPWTGRVAQAEADFHTLHAQRYGHRLGLPVELVNVRVAVHAPVSAPRLVTATASGVKQADVPRVAVWGHAETVPVYARETLAVGQRIRGPALVTETVATTYLAAHWEAEKEAQGNLLLQDRR